MTDTPPITLPTPPPIHSHDPSLRHVYTDAKNNHYFEFVNDANMPYKRYVDAQVHEKMMRLGMSRTGLEEIAKACTIFAQDATRTKEQLQADLYTISLNITGRLGYLAQQREFELYAAIFYLLQDEPLVPSDHWYITKRDLWADDEAARDFFLLGAFRKLNNLANISIEDIRASFQAAAIREMNLPTLPQK